MTQPEHRPSDPSWSAPPRLPPPSRGVLAFLWLVTGAGFVLGPALVALGLVGLAQGLSLGAGLGVAAAGVFFLGCGLWYLRLLLTHRRAAAEYEAARADLDSAVAEARTRLEGGGDAP